MPISDALEGAGQVEPTATQQARQNSAQAYRFAVHTMDGLVNALIADVAAQGGLQAFADSLTVGQHAALSEFWPILDAYGAIMSPPVAVPNALPAQS